MNNKEYSGKNIKVLHGLEAVRKRPGMYIGDTGVEGLHHMIWEVFDNSLDEAIAGFGDIIEIELYEDNSISVKDNGRGIPVDIHPSEKIPTATVVLTVLHAGGKFDDATYKTSGGLHGVGASVVNALSEKLVMEICRDSKKFRQEFCMGVPVSDLENIGTCDNSGTKIWFKPDKEIFKETLVFDSEIIKEKLKSISFLNKGLKIIFKDHIQKKENIFVCENGLSDFVDSITEEKLIPSVLYGREEENITLNFAFSYEKVKSGKIISYANNVLTHEGGTHEVGVINGFVRAIQDKIKQRNIKDASKISSEDIKEGLVFIISVLISNPEFKGQTKGKLNNPEVRPVTYKITKSYMDRWLEENPKEFNLIVKKIQTSRKAREAAKRSKENILKKENNSIGVLPTKLADCRTRKRELAELFLVEGSSAGGSAKQARDREFQAILPLKGKILNVYKAKLSDTYKHEEVGSIITALGCGVGNDINTKKLRYGKIIIMTDADIDGGHIMFLLILMFYKLFKPLIENGNIYISVPPLYRISKSGESYYFNSDKDLEEFLRKNYKGKKKRISTEELLIGWNKTRFKGLGEMNPDQLKETSMVDKTRKIVKLTTDSIHNFFGSSDEDISKVLEVLGGKNVDFRRWFLMNFTETILEEN